MGVPFTFASATAPLPLSELDTNFATPITLGTTSLVLGTTVTALTGLTSISSSTFTGGTWTGSTIGLAYGGTGLTGYTAGDLLYASSPTALAKLPIGTSGKVLTSTGSIPQWSDIAGYAVTSFSAGTTGFTPSTSTIGAVTLAGTLNVANGGTGLTSLTANRIPYGNGTNPFANSASLTFDGSTLSATNISTSGSLTVSGATALNGGTTLGDASGDALTINSSAVSIPNGLNFDSNTFVIDATNNRVGVGTSSPSYPLDVNGIINSNNSIRGTQVLVTNTNGITLSDDIASGFISYGYNSGRTNAASHVWYNGITTERMRITSAGNVGIGTTAPAARLVSAGSSSTVFKALILRNGDGTVGSSATIDFEASTGTQGDEGSMAGRIAGVRTGSGTSGALTFSTTNAGVLGERMRIDSSGNLGLGVTPSAWDTSYKTMQVSYGSVAANTQATILSSNWYYNAGDKYISTFAASQYVQFNGIHKWFNAPSGTAGNAITFTQAMTLDASGYLLVGTTNARTSRLSLEAEGTSTYVITTNTTAASGTRFHMVFREGGTERGSISSNGSANSFNISSTSGLGGVDANTVTINTNSTERMRIDSSGNLLVGDTTSGTVRLRVTNSASDDIALFKNSNATPYGVNVAFSGASPNNTTSYFYTCADSGATTRFKVYSNGGIANYSANNVNLSDERTKTDIVNAGNYLAKICAIPVRTFKYKDQTDNDLNLGVIAQEVEAVAPELVSNDGFGETPEDGIPLKAIYQTDLVYALMKSIQELTAKVTALEAQLNK